MTKRHFWTLFAGLLAASAIAHAKVVINEILYHAPNELEDLEFIELHNASEEPADLSGWSFTKGIKFKFTDGTRVAPRGFLVVCRERARFQQFYPADVAGTFDQPLSNNGERIELSDAKGAVVDSVKYKDRPPWPLGPDGYGASLERICPSEPGELPENWAGSPLPADAAKPGGTPGKPNASYSANLPPIVTAAKFSPANPAPEQAVTVEVEVRDADGLKEVSLRYRLAGAGFEQDESSVPMVQSAGHRFTATIPGQKANQILRFRIQAVDHQGAQRHFPSENEPRPALSCFVHDQLEPGKIPLGLVLNVGEPEFKAAQKRRQSPGRGGFTEEGRMRWMAEMTLKSSLDLAAAWVELTLHESLDFERIEKLRPIFAAKQMARDQLIEKTLDGGNFEEKMRTIPDLVKNFYTELNTALKPVLSEEQQQKLAAWQQQSASANAGGPMNFGPERMLKQFVALEPAYFAISTRTDVNASQFKRLQEIYRTAVKERGDLVEPARKLMSGEGDFEGLQERAATIDEGVTQKLNDLLTPEQNRHLANWRAEQGSWWPGGRRAKAPESPVGRSAFVFVDPQTRAPELFDFVHVAERSGGFKVHFQTDRPLREMTTINLIFEYNERFVLAEPLAYEVYRRAGNAACLTDFVRLSIDGQPEGYHLLVEQPNGAFLRRNQVKTGGNLYKILWYERGVVRQHEKKTNLSTGHNDVVALVEQLEKSKGDAQWAIIKKHLDVEQVINYFAVNTVLSHWDGFFNNYFTYHDLNGTGKWTMYPWDQDKTWGFHDGLGEGGTFFDMPLTFGMEGDRPPGWDKDRPPPRGFGGRNAWWRAGGFFSKPLLANPQFRQLFLARTKELLETVYTAEKFDPVIDQLRDRLKDEVRLRAEMKQENPDEAQKRFDRNLAQLKDHLVKRRAFLFEQDGIKTAGKFSRADF
ncbi:MAG: CotH kinase family protein [Verrucomicrobia bacterium]|nr:CotH kinase family protein [Verrucomicrobiota bacterium]